MTQLKLYPAEVIRTLDRRYVQEYDTSGLKLMGKAARSVLAFIESEMPNAERAQVFCGSTQKTRTDHEKFAKSKGSSWPGTIPVNVCRHAYRHVCRHVYRHVCRHV